MDMWGGRRKLMAKTLMDIAKITIAAVFASEFLFKFPFYVKVGVYMFLASNIVAALFVHPKGGE